ncbi:helix-turn-helix domain-containing protein [Streptomyces sp. NPDC049916]|uniref:AraC-like ligand-binding domain-containing protein n=1 Tax=Streptomyces sp. NPDC049916 TaxID=3155156 RepID=UPI0034400A48
MNAVDTFVETLAASGLPPLRGGRHTGEVFRADVVTRRLGPLRMAELVTPAGECFRDERSARAADSGLWQVELVTRGRVRAQQGRGTAELGPADLVLIDPARPVRFASTATTHVTLLLPRDSLRLRPDDAARLAGVRVPGDRGPAALVFSLARDMVRSLDGFPAGEADRSAAAVTELISAALADRLGQARRPVPDDALRTRITGFISARLADRDLSPAKVAAAHHISVRRLHKLFEDQPLTVAALIRRERLARCHADLARSGRTVAAVAAGWGFTDAAHFSRLFKATYGYNATALMSRNRAPADNASPVPPAQDGG